jgi:hypothetical protein
MQKEKFIFKFNKSLKRNWKDKQNLTYDKQKKSFNKFKFDKAKEIHLKEAE